MLFGIMMLIVMAAITRPEWFLPKEPPPPPNANTRNPTGAG